MTSFNRCFFLPTTMYTGTGTHANAKRRLGQSNVVLGTKFGRPHEQDLGDRSQPGTFCCSVFFSRMFVCLFDLNTETDVCWRCCWLCIRPRNAKRRARRRLRRCGGSGRSSSSTPVKCGTSTKVRVAILLLSLLTRLMEVVVLFVVVQHCFFLYSPALFAPTYTVDATCGTGG